jgi:hypothetical protein
MGFYIKANSYNFFILTAHANKNLTHYLRNKRPKKINNTPHKILYNPSEVEDSRLTDVVTANLSCCNESCSKEEGIAKPPPPSQ